MLGFPVLVVIIRYLLIWRIAKSCYPTTDGISVFECVARSVYFFCLCKRFTMTYRVADDDLPVKKKKEMQQVASLLQEKEGKRWPKRFLIID